MVNSIKSVPKKMKNEGQLPIIVRVYEKATRRLIKEFGRELVEKAIKDLAKETHESGGTAEAPLSSSQNQK